MDGQGFWSVADYEAHCRTLTPPDVFASLYGRVGEPDWSTHTANVEALRRVRFRPRVLRDVSRRTQATTLLGTPVRTPVTLAPTGDLMRLDPEGELSTARAAATAGVVYVVSASPSVPVAEIAAANAGGTLWQQLFLLRDRAITEWQLAQAAEVGARAVVWTVSNTGAPTRRRPPAPDPAAEARRSAPAAHLAGYPHGPVPSATELARSWDNSATWADVAWFRARTTLPLVVKGVQTAEDARAAVDHGVDGIVVSNHGGRMLPDARATIDALPEVVDAVDGRAEVYVDGGFQTGHDELKALALGARSAFVGRAARWGQRVAGTAGILDVLRILGEELDVAMAWTGVADVAEAGPDLVVADPPGRGHHR